MSKNTNTVSKGDKFESQVHDLIKKLVENEEFIVSGKKSRVFWKKGYYSQARKKDIIFDISIETYLENAKDYSSLIIIECKDYEGTVPVNDVEEFGSKLNQVGEHNTKGIIFTKTAFQLGASNFAVSKGIGIAIINSENEIDWINYRKDNKNSTSNAKTTDSASFHPNKSKSFFAFVDNIAFDNLPELLINLGIIDKYVLQQNKIYVPFKTDKQIEEKISQLQADKFYKEDKLIFDDLCESLSESLNVEFIFDENLGFDGEDKILGKITFKPLKIYITKDLKLSLNRWRFTLAHEVGHLILHDEILREYLGEQIDIEKTISLTGKFPAKANKFMEIQANKFASMLLLPEKPFLIEVGKYFNEQNINKGYLYVDHQRVNQTLLHNLLDRLREKFEVSKEVSKYRLSSFGLLQGETMSAVKDILKNI